MGEPNQPELVMGASVYTDYQQIPVGIDLLSGN